ncbi:MAG: helix-turn-helix domain-containing protein [Janthinobacterium lividum]
MNWTERLNRSLGRMPLGEGTAEFLHWASVPHLPDNRPHRHTFFEVCLVGTHGRGEFVVQGQANTIGPGDLFIARPGVIHQIINTGETEMELRWVSFQWTPALKPISEVDSLFRAFSNSPLVVVREETGAVAALWQLLEVIAGASPNLCSEAQYQALTAALLLGIAQAGADSALTPLPEPDSYEAGDLPARLAVRFIHDNLYRALPLPEIADQVHLSPRHLSRIFACFTGKSIAHYITHARMDRARGLLLHSVLPIKEIAAIVGYPDVHHFTRVFASHFGCPPGEMRRHPERHPVPNIQNPGDLV